MVNHPAGPAATRIGSMQNSVLWHYLFNLALPFLTGFFLPRRTRRTQRGKKSDSEHIFSFVSVVSVVSVVVRWFFHARNGRAFNFHYAAGDNNTFIEFLNLPCQSPHPVYLLPPPPRSPHFCSFRNGGQLAPRSSLGARRAGGLRLALAALFVENVKPWTGG